jgi:hypothetical protein
MSQPVSFAGLQHLLENLAFRLHRRPRHVLFEHQPSDTLIVLRPYRARDRVHPTDLAIAKTMLDQRSLLSGGRFDQALSAAAA